MVFKTIDGREKNSKVKKYLIDWDGKSRSIVQFKTKQFLKKFWKNCVVFEEFPVVGTRYSLDIYNANYNIAIEVQGKQHYEYVSHFHNKNKANWLMQLKRDDAKRKFCEINEIELYEITEQEVCAGLTKSTFKKQGLIL